MMIRPEVVIIVDKDEFAKLQDLEEFELDDVGDGYIETNAGEILYFIKGKKTCMRAAS